jgi:mono/diheme cytochrome c family protein
MLCALMSRFRRLTPPSLLLCAAALAVAGCGSHGNQLAANDPNFQGAMIFEEHCSGCHTLSAAGTEGSASDIGSREYKDGPNFNQRKETVDDVMYAIENGGFSSGPMPQNIVTGEDAKKVAQFVAKYSGSEAARPPNPQGGGAPAAPGATQPSDTQ